MRLLSRHEVIGGHETAGREEHGVAVAEGAELYT